MIQTSSFQVYNASAGSGKTYTLVKSYLKIILSSPSLFKFQEILALTFTNKAAGEMKSRILDNLKMFSEGTFNDMADDLCSEIPLEKDKLAKQSGLILNEILNHYTAFSITTIDSFTYKLIRNFAFDLGLSLNFDVELNSKLILEHAVELLVSKIGKDQKITNILLLFALFKWQQEQTWDVSFALNDIAQLLTNENAILEVDKLKQQNLDSFLSLHKKLKTQISKFENKASKFGAEGLNALKQFNIDHAAFVYKEYPNFLKKLVKADFKTISFEGRLAKNVANQAFYKKGLLSDDTLKIDEHANDFVDLFYKVQQFFDTDYASYVLAKLIINKLIPLSVLSEINKCLDSYKTENNIRLNAEFNQIIRDHIKNEPVPFIYEKIGEKYSHFFIDEMQDTSIFQWENLIPLIGNALSQPNSSLFLVGDAKQAIYRWRGGKAQQFIDLALDNHAESEKISNKEKPFFVAKKIETLDTNFRSYSEVIEFNNQFFTNTSKFLTNKKYKKLYEIGNNQKANHKKGGYVQIDFIERPSKTNPEKTSYADKILGLLKNLDSAYNLGDVCVLVRQKSEGVKIAQALTEAGYSIVTSDALLLVQSDKVNFMIDILKFITEPKDQKSLAKALIFLHQHLNIKQDLPDFLKLLVKQTPTNLWQQLNDFGIEINQNILFEMSLYRSLTYLINHFKLIKTSDAYLQYFLDEVLKFELQKKGDLSQFLDYFEQKKDDLSIVAPQNNQAIKILTIHKAKGLEFPIVIFPNNENIHKEIKPTVWYHPKNIDDFNGFDSLLADGGQRLEQTDDLGKAIYAKRKKDLELDHINLLYVGLTRAVEQLYIITEQPSNSSKTINYAQIIMDFLQTKNLWLKNQFTYSFGSNKRPNIKVEKIDSSQNITTEFISTNWESHHINIVSNASKYWNNQQKKGAIFGTLIHDILAEIKTADDIDMVLNRYLKIGKITRTDVENLNKTILEIVNHPQLKSYYNQKSEIFNECEILSNNGQLYRLDRLVIKNNCATIIDYKTGTPQKSHQEQLKTYQQIVSELNIKVSDKILIYLQSPLKLVFVD